MPGSKDLVDFDYISDQPDIVVETWEDPSLLAEACKEVVTSEAQVAEIAALDGGGDHAHARHQQQVIGAADAVDGFQDPHASSAHTLTEGIAGVQVGEGEHTGGPEFKEYLDSQESFSYDRPLTDASAATPTTEGVVDRDCDARTPAGAGADTITASGAPDLGPEHWGWGSPTAASPNAEVQLGNYPVDGCFGAEVDYEAAGAADNSLVSQGMLTAEADDYNPSTPSYGLDE